MAGTVEAPVTDLMTGEELEKMPNLGRCELVEGRVVTMSPTGDVHGGCEVNFGRVLSAFVLQRGLGKVRVGEVGVYTHRDPDSVRGADVLFISNERYAQKKSRSFLDVAPDLIVEVLSPEDRWSEVTQKLREYFSIGVRLIWVADPESRTVYAYRSMTDIREFAVNDELPGDDVLPGFSVKVAELFED